MDLLADWDPPLQALSALLFDPYQGFIGSFYTHPNQLTGQMHQILLVYIFYPFQNQPHKSKSVRNGLSSLL